MATVLLNIPKPNEFDSRKPGQLNIGLIVVHLRDEKPLLSDFITERSLVLFFLIPKQTFAGKILKIGVTIKTFAGKILKIGVTIKTIYAIRRSAQILKL